MQMGIVENNPIIGTIQPKDSKARERVLSDDELAATWRACKDDDYGRIIRLLILLGCPRAQLLTHHLAFALDVLRCLFC
jgi:integrase